MIRALDRYRNPDLCLAISDRIRAISKKKINIMEVCGGHTAAIRKNGIHKLVGENIRLVSGPGCPVCVTDAMDIDRAIALADFENTAVLVFGDLFYVPGTSSSLAEKKAAGRDVRIVYSAHDALDFAKREPGKKFVFISIGFETTAPTAAAAVIKAFNENVDNFYILALNKTMPRALKALLEDKRSKIDTFDGVNPEQNRRAQGLSRASESFDYAQDSSRVQSRDEARRGIDALICPGHVSAITGTAMYDFIADEMKIPCCISGFEPADIMSSIYILAELCEKGKTGLVNNYERVVSRDGNAKARYVMYEVFEDADASWRGLGVIPSSGLKVRDQYEKFDALKEFSINLPEVKIPEKCICHDILLGLKEPSACPLFGKICAPDRPKGACMVSAEGACRAWYESER